MTKKARMPNSKTKKQKSQKQKQNACQEIFFDFQNVISYQNLHSMSFSQYVFKKKKLLSII